MNLKDNTDFNQFIKDNIGNDEFKQFGRNNGMGAVRELWYQKRIDSELKNVHQISKEDAVDMVRDSISSNVLDGWFRSADSNYKPKLMESILSNNGTLNAGLNIAYNNYLDSNPSKVLSFDRWLKTPQTMYRGEYGQKLVKGDVFTSFTLDKNIAQGFGSNITVKRIRPIDTLGSFQTTGEQEFLVPIKLNKRR